MQYGEHLSRRCGWYGADRVREKYNPTSPRSSSSPATCGTGGRPVRATQTTSRRGPIGQAAGRRAEKHGAAAQRRGPTTSTVNTTEHPGSRGPSPPARVWGGTCPVRGRLDVTESKVIPLARAVLQNLSSLNRGNCVKQFWKKQGS